MPHSAINVPNAPPAVASTTLSISNSLTIRVFRAPRATRTAISCRRLSRCAAISPARLAQAMSRTKIVAVSMAVSMVRCFEDTIASRRRITLGPWRGPLVTGPAESTPVDSPANIAFACAVVTPSESRAIESTDTDRRPDCTSGTQMSVSPGKPNPTGATPTISCATPSSAIVRLMTAASAA